MLQEFSLEVIGATDGLEALDRLAERPAPGLVITGLMLPTITGTELARAAADTDLDVRFVLFTADPRQARFELARAGMDTVRVFDRMAGPERLVEYLRRA